MRRLLLAALLLATPVFAQRPIYPDDYKTNSCAPEHSCITYPIGEFKGSANAFFGWDMDPVWLQKHDAELRAAFEPFCRKHATCFTNVDNSDMFCNDIFSTEIYRWCQKTYPDGKSHDGEQCREYAQVFALGVDQNARALWGQVHACALQHPVPHTKPPEVWMVPDPLPYGYKKDVTFYALDPDTHVPVYARITFEDHIVYAPSNPNGQTASYYPFPFKFHYVRVPNAEGHTDVVPPMVTVSAEGYPETKFRLSTPPPPKLTVEMTPSKLHPGENKVTVTAKDPEGKPVEMRVMAGDHVAGMANEPITIDWPKGEKRPEVWVTSLFDRYNDTVVAK
jgi:hypothetical protein